MAVTKHPTGGNRAYKKIGGIEYQRYSFDADEADAMQAELDAKSRIHNSLKAPVLFSKSGHLVHLRVRKYKKTNRATFQLQVLNDGKQVKIESFIKGTFESHWKTFFKLWRTHFKLSMLDVAEYRPQILFAKRLYMSEVYKLKISDQA